LYGRAGRLTAKNGGFRPGQEPSNDGPDCGQGFRQTCQGVQAVYRAAGRGSGRGPPAFQGCFTDPASRSTSLSYTLADNPAWVPDSSGGHADLLNLGLGTFSIDNSTNVPSGYGLQYVGCVAWDSDTRDFATEKGGQGMTVCRYFQLSKTVLVIY
jgi:hypothetical protein